MYIFEPFLIRKLIILMRKNHKNLWQTKNTLYLHSKIFRNK